MTSVFLHGGGDMPEAREATFGRFVHALEINGPLLIIAVGTDEAEAGDTARYYVELFAALGMPAERLASLILGPGQMLVAEQVAAYSPCGVFVCGGVTPFYHRVLCADTGWVAWLRARGVPYGGTSAGAAIAATTAILGGWQTFGGDEPRPILFRGASEGLDALTVRPGLGLVPFAVDVHAAQTGTLTRLVQAVAGRLADEGWAIDEDTQLEVRPAGIHVAGRGGVYHVTRDAEGRVVVEIAGAT